MYIAANLALCSIYLYSFAIRQKHENYRHRRFFASHANGQKIEHAKIQLCSLITLQSLSAEIFIKDGYCWKYTTILLFYK